MATDERERWNQRYREGRYRPRPDPSPFLVAWTERLRPEGRALDLACGTGRNALHLAEQGWRVDAVDIAEEALSVGRGIARDRGLELDWRAEDLDDWAPEPARYALITVFRYRNEALWPRLAAGLVDGGWLIVEHHLRSGADLDGPSTDDFRVAPGELLRAADGLRVVHYSEQAESERSATTGDRENRFALARVVACAGDPARFGPPELATPA